MRYNYDVYRPGALSGHERFDSFMTNTSLARYFPDEPEPGHCGIVVPEFSHITVTDNLNRRAVFTIVTREDYESWLETMMRNEVWKGPASVKPTETISVPATNTLADNNVKTAAAFGKPKLSVVPPIGLFALGAAMENGADKYGAFNWRETAVTSSVFFDAMLRHLIYWYCGENKAADSRVHHLGHTMAGGAILLDAELFGVLKDDRNTAGHDPEELLKKMFEIIKG